MALRKGKDKKPAPVPKKGKGGISDKEWENFEKGLKKVFKPAPGKDRQS